MSYKLDKAFRDFASSIAGHVRTATLKSVTVQSVDDEYAYVSVFDDDTPTAVPLTITGLPQGMARRVPNVGSACIVGFIDGNENSPFLVACNEVDTFTLKRGKTELKWVVTPLGRDDNGDAVEGETDDEITLTLDTASVRIAKDIIEFNGGTLGDLVVIQKLTDRLNKLQGEIDRIQSAISSHTHVYIDSKGQGATPVSSVTNPASYSKVTLTNVQNSDYNNEKITQ